MVSTVHKKGNGYLLPVDGMEDHMPDLLSIPEKKKKKSFSYPCLFVLGAISGSYHDAIRVRIDQEGSQDGQGQK